MSGLTISKFPSYPGYNVVADGKYQFGTIELGSEGQWKFYPNQGGFDSSELIQVIELMKGIDSENP